MIKHATGRDMISDYNYSDIVWESSNIGRNTSTNSTWE